MRLTVCANGRFYYDIGLRKHNHGLSNTMTTFCERHPRFLEDFVKAYGAGNVSVVSLGSLEYESKYIEKLGVQYK